jgi:purine nucleosidase
MAALVVLALPACGHESHPPEDPTPRMIDVVFDTDANNEVDDQHALAYLLFSGDHFHVEGVTVNATSDPSGFDVWSDVRDHYDEARRVMQLCGEVYGRIPLLLGAQDAFEDIRPHLDEAQFDGHAAIDFIIEHNKVWDAPAMNFLLESDVPFEMVTVRYAEPSGTTAVRVTQAQILHRMPGKGPRISTPVTGRHGGEFDNWGDYSANLFEMYDMYGSPPSRSLFDMAAVAIVKNPEWAERRLIPAPIFDVENDRWIDRPDNPRQIALWEWFDVYGIMNDFFVTMREPVLVQ